MASRTVMKLLVVANSAAWGDTFSRVLTEAGYAVERCQREFAIDLVVSDRPDVMLVEWRSPDNEGMMLCRQVRRAGSDAYIILVSDGGDVRDKIAALDAGADDYIVQPVDLRELVARARALERRSGVIRRGTRSYGRLVLNERDLTVSIDGDHVDLTVREFRLLSFLLQYAGETVTRADIVAHVWSKVGRVGSNVVDVYIRRLRAKLGPAGEQVKTIRGVGYRFEISDRQAANS